MNGDIVYTLCPYLELPELFALAAACPIFSPIVRKYMEKKKLKVELKLECNGEDILKYFKPLTRTFEVLSKCVWKEVPSCVLAVHALEITQKSFGAISKDAYALLTKITTSRLAVEFIRRSEARRVLQAISIEPDSRVQLWHHWLEEEKEPPILVQSELARFKRIEYRGYDNMLYNDFVEALDTERATVRYVGTEGRQARWIAGFIKRYAAAERKQVRCVRRYPAEYEIERVPERGATQSTTGRRTITVSSFPSPGDLLWNDTFLTSFVVENSFE